MMKNAKSSKRVTITGDIIDKVWNLYKSSPNMYAIQRAVGISNASVYRIVKSCIKAQSGRAVQLNSDCPGVFMCNYINAKFADVIARCKCNEIQNSEDKKYRNNIFLKGSIFGEENEFSNNENELANVIKELTKQLEEHNRLIKKFLAKLEA